MPHFHSLTINENKITLDDFKLNGVISYSVSESVNEQPVATFAVYVNDIRLDVQSTDKRAQEVQR